MMRRNECQLARFKPYASAFQSRFKWKHKPSDKWRRLMDSTCFSVDWITRPMGPTLGQSSGFWTHILTPAHCACPWDYPNYYPPFGDTRFVSKITYGDTRTQIRFVTQQGDVAMRFFLSNNHTFTHSNLRLDLAVLHPEQYLRKQGGELKLAHMQNKGHVMRPMLDIAAPVQKGDIVWIYGMTAEEALFDEEKGEEPKMIPTAIRGIVHATTREQFWVDTMGQEVFMGMCGAPVMRNGKCVGMLTAKVHAQSDTKELAGCAMCTYSKDIFEFLMEVEAQLKNGMARINEEMTHFERQRIAEARQRAAMVGGGAGEVGTVPQTKILRSSSSLLSSITSSFSSSASRVAPVGGEDGIIIPPAPDPQAVPRPYRDWSKDQTRLARRLVVPVSNFTGASEMEWNSDEGFEDSNLYGPTGVLDDETQENFGFHMAEDRDKFGKPCRLVRAPPEPVGGRVFDLSPRTDTQPEGIYGEEEIVVDGRIVKKGVPEVELVSNDLKEMLAMEGSHSPVSESMYNLRDVVSQIHRSDEMEALRNSAFATGGADDKGAAAAKGAYTRGGMERATAEAEAAAGSDSSSTSSNSSGDSSRRTVGHTGPLPTEVASGGEGDKVFVGGKEIPQAFVKGFAQYTIIEKQLKEKERAGQRAVGGGSSDDVGNGYSESSSSSSSSERRRRGGGYDDGGLADSAATTSGGSHHHANSSTSNSSSASSSSSSSSSSSATSHHQQHKEQQYEEVSATRSAYTSPTDAKGQTAAQKEAEELRRAQRKAQRAAERAKKDAAHHAALMARHGGVPISPFASRVPPEHSHEIASGSDLTAGLW